MVIRVVATLKRDHGLDVSARAFLSDPRVGAIAQAASPM